MRPFGPLIAAAAAGIGWQNGLPGPAAGCAFVGLVCALWWIFECFDIAIVGLLPMMAFPVLGVMDHNEVARSYGHSMIWLLMGGFFLSAAMERSGAHRRVALTMVRLVGGRGGRRLVLGFMLATAGLSMWISNSATTLMMLPIALAVLQQSGDPTLRTPLLLAIAYSASVGGMATPIGTPPNLVFTGYMAEQYGIEVGFFEWMSFGIPIVLCLLPIIWIWLTRNLDAAKPIAMPPVGRWRQPEIRVLAVFTATAAAWMFRTGPAGGWVRWLGLRDVGGDSIIGDTTVAIAAALFLFACPSGEPPPAEPLAIDAGPDIGVRSIRDQRSSSDNQAVANANPSPPDQPNTPQSRWPPTLLDWPTALSIPWGILLMFGGGLALGEGFKTTGLSEMIGGQLAFVSAAPYWVIVAVVCLLVNFLTEITSSTATANLMMPILGALAVATNLPAELILIPGTISASCAFMLPVATAPNVIVFGAGGLRTDEMAKNGFILNLIAAVVVVGMSLLLLSPTT